MADQHEKGNGEVVRGRDERPPQSDDTLVEGTDESSVGPGDDLAGIRADDALLDALGGRAGEQPESLVDDELNALLLAWRREVDSPPVGELVDTDTAVATIAAARPQPRGRHRFLIPIASAAAVLAIAFTGMSLVARDAQPGDTLWGLTRVLYSEHARSIEAAVAVKDDLALAHAALRDGRYSEARDALLKVEEVLPSVSPDDGKDDLVQEHKSLLQELTSTTPTPTGTPSTATPSTTPVVPTTTVQVSPTVPTTDAVTTTAPTTTTQTVPTTDGTAHPPPPTSVGTPSGSGQTRGETRGETATPGSTDGNQTAPEN